MMLVAKNPPANPGDTGLIPRSGRSPGEGNGNLLQYSCLENPINRGAWRAIVHGIAKSAMTEPLTHTHTHVHTPDDEMFLFIFNNAFCLKVDFV